MGVGGAVTVAAHASDDDVIVVGPRWARSQPESSAAIKPGPPLRRFDRGTSARDAATTGRRTAAQGGQTRSRCQTRSTLWRPGSVRGEFARRPDRDHAGQFDADRHGGNSPPGGVAVGERHRRDDVHDGCERGQQVRQRGVVELGCDLDRRTGAGRKSDEAVDGDEHPAEPVARRPSRCPVAGLIQKGEPRPAAPGSR